MGCVRGQLKCDGTRTETRLFLSAKRTSPFKTAGASVQSNTGSRGVRISGSNAGYNMFRGSVKSTGQPLHSPLSPSLPLPCVNVCHYISAGVYQVIGFRLLPGVRYYSLVHKFLTGNGAHTDDCTLYEVIPFHRYKALGYEALLQLTPSLRLCVCVCVVRGYVCVCVGVLVCVVCVWCGVVCVCVVCMCVVCVCVCGMCVGVCMCGCVWVCVCVCV